MLQADFGILQLDPLLLDRDSQTRNDNSLSTGMAIVLVVDGCSAFNALHSNRQNDEVQLCAFDMLALAGEDLHARGADDF